ncbi:MAG: CGNR zinc finger domain-containing protein [Rhodococcus sp. (in: high G+C Gram-positive bacteria)]
MLFTHDTRTALVWAAALINTSANDDEYLTDTAVLASMLDEHEWTGRRDGSLDELDTVRALRGPWREIWTLSRPDDVVPLVNDMLDRSDARPHLTRHGDWGWHLHMSDDNAPLADRMNAETAVALAEIVRAEELGRLRVCESPDCDAVVIDLSRNRSRRYCDTGNCGNRANVAAYRARKQR